MATVDIKLLSTEAKDELVLTYSALLLHDSGLDISEEKLNKVIKASGNTVEPYWPGLFAKALKGHDIDALLASIGSVPAGAAAPIDAPDAVAVDAKKDEVKAEESAEEDVDMGGLFGDDGY